MLKEQPWLNYSGDLHIELEQSGDEGKDVKLLEERVRRLQAMDKTEPDREKLAAALLDEAAVLAVDEAYPFEEPSDLASIKAARPDSGSSSNMEGKRPAVDEAFEKVYGAWLGRCSGCLLGKPVEGWHRERITGLLRDTGNYPFKYYISSDIPEELVKRYNMLPNPARPPAWIDKVTCAPEDDDTNYTLIGLKVLERSGRSFTPEDVAETWLADLPILHVCTAERVAYKNLVNMVLPPLSASYRNPYREWIGAQIRADFYGYINQGNPELAAEMAWRDASISHVKNGIYGEMFVAAMLAEAFTTSDIERIIGGGISQIPAGSRLYKEVAEVLEWKREGISWENAIDRIHARYNEKNEHHWCHTISNAMIVCIGLLFGELDFEKSIGIAVAAGFDTDCNGATVGSVVGAILGAKGLPEKWIKPLNDQLKSGVDGFGLVSISEIARRTVRQME